jgi:polyvinyl alcohol dehydrogenase (cytochrome)
MRRSITAVLKVTATVLLVAGGGVYASTASEAGTAQVRLAPTDWPTYHHDNSRAGVATGLAPVGTLSTAWTARLDGAVYGQPLVVGNRVFAATENDTVYALDAATGRVVWSRHLGTPMRQSALPCGNIDPLGITSTMVFDPATNLLFALGEFSPGGAHVLVSLDAATGAVRQRRAADPPKGTRVAHLQRPALTLFSGRVYMAYGGLLGDCGRYFGTVVGLPVTGSGPAISFVVPTTREGGIWGTAGAAVIGGRLMFSVGNGASTTTFDGSDSVTALSPELKLLDRFAPSTWAADNARDLDLGSMGPIAVNGFVYANGKRSVGYTLRPTRLGGIGGQVAMGSTCSAFGAAAVSGNTVYVPCTSGTRAVRISTTGAISTLWRAPVPARGSPSIGGGAVWVVDYDGGVLYALNPSTGAVRQRLSIGRAPHFASPTLSVNRAYVGTMTGVVAVAGA